MPRKMFLFVLAVMLMQSVCFADCSDIANTIDYLDGDCNFPLTGSYGGRLEYTALDSCQIIEDGDELQFSVGYIVKTVHDKNGSYKVRYFKWQRTGDARPQFRNDADDEWTVIPEPDRHISRAGDAKTYHIMEYRMFKTACEYLFSCSETAVFR
jgi:hypothetical protein